MSLRYDAWSYQKILRCAQEHPQRRFDVHTDIARAAEKGDAAFTLPMLPAGESDATVFAVVRVREKNADVKN